MRGTQVERMDHGVVVAEDMKHRRDREGNLAVVFHRGEKRRLQPAERHDVSMAVFGAFGKSRCAAGKKHHRVVIGIRQRLR